MDPGPDAILERTQWDFFWLPEDAEVCDRPEILYARCARDVPYLNTVARTRAPAERLPELVREVDAAHAGVLSRWLVPGTYDTAPLEAALDAAGYLPAHEHFAYATDVETFRPRGLPGILVRPVDGLERLRDCTSVVDRAFGGPLDRTESELRDDLARCTEPEARVFRCVAYDETTGDPLASGGMNLYPELGFGFLWAGGTVPEARGRGAYSAVVAARVARAHELGFRMVGLYARVGTSAPIVARQGFAQYGRMVYWDRPLRRSGSPAKDSKDGV